MEHKICVVIPIIVIILMMTRIVFSQMSMEIYAYSFMAKRTGEISNHIITVKEEQKKREEHRKTSKAKDRKSTNNTVVLYFKPVSGGVSTSGFGDTIDRNKGHKGHDWAVPVGTKVMAAAGGVVEKAYLSRSYGYNVLINHKNGTKTRYAHMSKLYVIQGQYVNQKDIVGLSGNTGDSTGPHLHFEVIQNGKFINPLSVLK